MSIITSLFFIKCFVSVTFSLCEVNAVNRKPMNKLMTISYSFVTTLCPMNKLTIISYSFITTLSVGTLDSSKNLTGVHKSFGR